MIRLYSSLTLKEQTKITVMMLVLTGVGCGGASKNPYPPGTDHNRPSTEGELQGESAVAEFHCLYPQESLDWSGSMVCPFKKMAKGFSREAFTTSQEEPAAEEVGTAVTEFTFPVEAGVLQIHLLSGRLAIKDVLPLSLSYSREDTSNSKDMRWSLQACHDVEGVSIMHLDPAMWDGRLYCDVKRRI